MDNLKLNPPNDEKRVFLHVCCAPCSAAIIESLLESDISPVLFFFNPNIHPEEEYLRRKEEIVRFAGSKNIPMVDIDYNTETWFNSTKGHEEEPERGKRCFECFKLRLDKTASYATLNNLTVFATTMGISRWKDMDMVNKAGHEIQSSIPFLSYWDINWRKNGGSEKMVEVTKRENFYRQDYCGCVYSQK